MKKIRGIVVLVLAVLLVATLYGVMRTGRQPPVPPGNGAATAGLPEQDAPVDQAAFSTAQELARAPTSPAELSFAQDALRVGDEEMDLAFALAVLDAAQHPPVLTAEAKQIQSRLRKAEDLLTAAQARVAGLTASDGKATGSQRDALDDQLGLAKAQLELRQDEVDDAKQDLVRAGGDPQGRIQQLLQEHEAASQVSDATKVAVVAPVDPRGLIQRFQQWSALHGKQLQLWGAKHDAVSAAAAFAARHESLERQTSAQNGNSGGAAVPGSEAASPAVTEKSANSSRAESADLLAATKERAVDSRILATLDKRMANEKELAGVYGQWISVVAAQQRSLVNGVLRGLSSVLLAIAMIGVFVDDGVENLFAKTPMDRRQLATLRTATRVALQVVGALVVLVVIFGSPTQLGAILGLVGAGLTIAMQDFIVAFFGRFVLMGKNGIRLGDWVEINGVTGEVAELGMFHTVLLETGNWTDSGHPTGRRVTFTNSFAVQGHYFNFSTSGQWLWDELQIVLPAGENPYPIVDALQKQVVEATSESVRQAEDEWHNTSGSRAMKGLSAAPAISVKPVIGGIQISVRYITHASQRADMRAKLNHAAVDLLGSGLAPGPDADSARPTPGPTDRGKGAQDVSGTPETGGGSPKASLPVVNSR